MWQPIREDLLKNTVWADLQSSEVLSLAEEDLAVLNKAFSKENVVVKIKLDKKPVT